MLAEFFWASLFCYSCRNMKSHLDKQCDFTLLVDIDVRTMEKYKKMKGLAHLHFQGTK